jgi:hypothetical protein
MGGNRGMGGPGQQQMQMQSPVMQQQQFSPGGPMGGMGGPMSGGRGPVPSQQQQQQQQGGGGFFSPAPSPQQNHHQQQQQQFTPSAQRSMQAGAYPVIQTSKTLDPFDSINNQQQFSNKSGSGRR